MANFYLIVTIFWSVILTNFLRYKYISYVKITITAELAMHGGDPQSNYVTSYVFDLTLIIGPRIYSLNDGKIYLFYNVS